MVEAMLSEVKHEEKVSIPELAVESKEDIDLYFKLMLAGTPHLKFSIENKKGKKLYSNFLNVEMR